MNILANPQIRNFVSRYRALERRDQLALIGLGIFLSLLFLYYGVWDPANSFFEARETKRDRELSLVKYMKASEGQAIAVRGGSVARSVSGQSLLTQVNRTTQQFNIKPNRLQPEGSEGVSVWFDDVVFNDLIRWLEMQSQQGVIVRQISIDRQPEAGKVNARVVLRS